MALERIKTDGSENGQTAADKINATMDAIELGMGINMTPKLGVNINTIIETGYYEVDTNLPYLQTLAELRVGHDTDIPTKIIQELRSMVEPFVYRRISNNSGTNWTLWEETRQTEFNIQAAERIDNTYTKVQVNRMVVSTYTGTELPDPNLGKTGDMYHRYASKVQETLETGVSQDDARADGFYLFDDFTQSGLTALYVIPSQNSIFTYFGGNGSPHAENFILNIEGTDIPLTVDYQTAGGVDFTYSSSFDAVINNIVSGDAWTLKTEKLSGKDEDYTKFDTQWYYTPIFDHIYEYNKIGGAGNEVTVNTTTFIDILDKDLGTLPAGVYEYKHSMTFTIDSTTKSLIFRFSLDGGATWEERSREVKDVTNVEDTESSFPLALGVEPVHLRLQAKVESGATAVIKYASQVFEKKR